MSERKGDDRDSELRVSRSGFFVVLLFLAHLFRGFAFRKTSKQRPPGAGSNHRGNLMESVLAEAVFLSRCIRCGQCGSVCPEQERGGASLKAIQVSQDGFDRGSPFIQSRTAACILCKDQPCVEACPTEALNLSQREIEDAVMGTAEIVNPAGCLAIQGLRCEVCYNRCPLIGKAIQLEKRVNQRTRVHVHFVPVVDPTFCTGCGICEQACVQDEPVIKVRGFYPLVGEPEHYRFKETS